MAGSGGAGSRGTRDGAVAGRRVPAGGRLLGAGRSRVQATRACPVVVPTLPSSPPLSLPLFGSPGGEAQRGDRLPFLPASRLPFRPSSLPTSPARLLRRVPPATQGHGAGAPSPPACPDPQPQCRTATGSSPASAEQPASPQEPVWGWEWGQAPALHRQGQ